MDWTRYPSSRETVPLQTVVDLDEPDDATESIGAIRSRRTSVTVRRIGRPVANQG